MRRSSIGSQRFTEPGKAQSDTRFDGAKRLAQTVSNLGLTQAFVVSQLDRQPLFEGEDTQCVCYSTCPLVLKRRVFWCQRLCCQGCSGLFLISNRVAGLPLLHPQSVQGPTPGNGDYPGSQRATGRIIRPGVSPDVPERFLEDFFRIGLISED